MYMLGVGDYLRVCLYVCLCAVLSDDKKIYMSGVSDVIAYACSKVIPPPACVLTNNTEVAAGSVRVHVLLCRFPFSIWLLIDKTDTFF